MLYYENVSSHCCVPERKLCPHWCVKCTSTTIRTKWTGSWYTMQDVLAMTPSCPITWAPRMRFKTWWPHLSPDFSALFPESLPSSPYQGREGFTAIYYATKLFELCRVARSLFKKNLLVVGKVVLRTIILRDIIRKYWWTINNITYMLQLWYNKINMVI